MSYPLTERNQKIIDLYDEGRGLSPFEIARQFKISRERVRQILNKAGLAGNLKIKVRQQTRKALIDQALTKNPLLKLSEIAQEIGISIPTAQRLSPARNFPALFKLRRRQKFIEDFKANVVESDTCWQWLGPVHSTNSYPLTNYPLKHSGSHRLQRHLWIYFHGQPSGWVVSTCNNKTCVNPSHLADISPSKACKEFRKPRGKAK